MQWAFMAAQTAHVIKAVNGSDAAWVIRNREPQRVLSHPLPRRPLVRSVFAFADYMYNQNGQNQFEVGVTQGNSTLDLQKAYAAGAPISTRGGEGGAALLGGGREGPRAWAHSFAARLRSRRGPQPGRHRRRRHLGAQ